MLSPGAKKIRGMSWGCAEIRVALMDRTAFSVRVCFLASSHRVQLRAAVIECVGWKVPLGHDRVRGRWMCLDCQAGRSPSPVIRTEYLPTYLESTQRPSLEHGDDEGCWKKAFLIVNMTGMTKEN